MCNTIVRYSTKMGFKIRSRVLQVHQKQIASTHYISCLKGLATIAALIFQFQLKTAKYIMISGLIRYLFSNFQHSHLIQGFSSVRKKYLRLIFFLSVDQF